MAINAQRRATFSPAARVLAAVILIVGIATVPPRLYGLGASGLSAIGLALWARPSPGFFFKRLAIALAAIAALTVPLWLTGDAVRALALSVRASAAASVAIVLASGLSKSDLPGALRSLGLSASLAALVGTTFEQLASLEPIARRIVLARQIRGAKGWVSYRTVIPEMLVRSVARAERVGLARELRGYDPALIPKGVGLTRQDTPLVLAAILGALAVHGAGVILG